MSDVRPNGSPVCFSVFEVDLTAGELRKHGMRVKLQEQPFQVLRVLLENRGQLVTREELQKRIWPSDTFVDFDHGLYNAVKKLREALGDVSETPRFIETLPKRGYRFIGSISSNGHAGVEVEEKTPVEPMPQAPSVAETPPLPRRRKRILWAVAAAVAIAVSVLGIRYVRHRSSVETAAPQIHSLAVLPVQNLSGDPNQEYFADGVTEELITELSRLENLKVISRTSVMRYKRTDKLLPQIARELGVDAIVEGSVLRSGDRVRITAQLISARSDANLWAETYDRSLEDSLGVQEEVATAIASKMKTSISPSAAIGPSARRQVNLRAHEAYLLGLHETNLGGYLWNHEGMDPAAAEHDRRAIEYYQEAIKEDPNYAPAYLGLVASSTDPDDVEAKARKALELDDTLSEAHRELGQVLLSRDFNWQGAEKEFVRAIEVNPSYAAAHETFAYYLDAVGRLDEGLKEYHLAQELDPANDHLGAALYSRRDYGPLIELEHRVLATNPPGDTSDNAIAHRVLTVAYARTGRHKESIEEMRSAVACLGYHDLAEEIRRGYAASGYRGALQAYMIGVKKLPDWGFHWFDAYVYTELGAYDQAFAQLAQMNKNDPSLYQWIGYILGMPNLASLRVEPMWDPLHSDARFAALVRQIGLP